MSTMPEQLARSLTWDRGKETSALARFKIETGIPILCLPPVALATRYETRTPIALCAKYFPKGADLSRWSAEEI